MNDGPRIPPKRILLATDLSGRGDRALDRAVQLAGTWDAELVVVHALNESAGLADRRGLPSWRWPPDMAAVVERQIREDVRGSCPGLRVHVEEGPVVQVILDAVSRERPDLVIVAGRRATPYGGPGKTVDELFRRCPVSVLVVKQRPHGPYRDVLVGDDFTNEARRGLEVAVRLFPEAGFTLMHAHEIAYASLRLDSPLSHDFSAMEQASLRDSLARADIPEDVRTRVATLIEHGRPEVMLSNYITEKGADLTVIGAYERGRLFHMVVGGMGPRIVQAAPGDVLVVRAEREAAPAD